MGKRINASGVLEYEVVWIPYGVYPNEWLPEEDLINADELVKEFESGIGGGGVGGA